jgi:hypothetical protein
MSVLSQVRWPLALLAGGACAWALDATSFLAPEPPSVALADRIDRVLAREPCIGSVNAWTSRYYLWGRSFWTYPAFGIKWLGSDTSIVDFRFQKQAQMGYYPPAGRHRLRADQNPFGLDSSEQRYAWGSFNVRTGEVSDFDCGWNSGRPWSPADDTQK